MNSQLSLKQRKQLIFCHQAMTLFQTQYLQEIYKERGIPIAGKLTKLFYCVWRKEAIPQEFKDASLIRLYKQKRNVQKGKQKSSRRATSRSRSQLPTPGGREKVTYVNVCIAHKQIHDKHKDQLPLPQAR